MFLLSNILNRIKTIENKLFSKMLINYVPKYVVTKFDLPSDFIRILKNIHRLNIINRGLWNIIYHTCSDVTGHIFWKKLSETILWTCAGNQ